MKIIKYGDGASSRPHEQFVIKNSKTILIGGPVKLVTGALEPADAVNDPIYGICVGFVGADGNTPYENLLPGQKGSADSYVKGASLAVSSDNETVAKVRAKVVPIQPNDVIRGMANADIKLATGANVGKYINVYPTNETLFKETTATSTKEQFLIVGIPGRDQPRALDVKLVEGQVFGQ